MIWTPQRPLHEMSFHSYVPEPRLYTTTPAERLPRSRLPTTVGDEPSSTWKPDHALLTMSLSSKRPRPCSYTHTPNRRSAKMRLRTSSGHARERTWHAALAVEGDVVVLGDAAALVEGDDARRLVVVDVVAQSDGLEPSEICTPDQPLPQISLPSTRPPPPARNHRPGRAAVHAAIAHRRPRGVGDLDAETRGGRDVAVADLEPPARGEHARATSEPVWRSVMNSMRAREPSSARGGGFARRGDGHRAAAREAPAGAAA